MVKDHLGDLHYLKEKGVEVSYIGVSENGVINFDAWVITIALVFALIKDGSSSQLITPFSKTPI